MSEAARAASKLTIDNPDADGKISEWGIGVDWVAGERRLQTLAWTADLSGQYGWLYGDDVEYIPKLNAIGPVGVAALAPMVLSQWTVNKGLWRESPSAGQLRTRWLQFYDGRPERLHDAFGSITSKGIYSQNLIFWIWRMPQPEDDTDPCLVDITWEGDGVVPRYRLRIPGAQSTGGTLSAETQTNWYPTLSGITQSASAWTTIDQHLGGGMTGYTTGQEALLQVVRVEYVDGWMLIRFNGQEDVWAYRGAWQDSDGHEVLFGPSAGPITLEVCGHPCFINVQQLAYADEAQIASSAWFFTPKHTNATPSYRVIKYEPNETADVSVAAQSLADHATRPLVTFTSDTINRPLLYRVQEYRAATVGAANSSAITTADNANLQLLAISGRCDEDWRGATIEATVEAAQGELLTDIAFNSKIKAQVTLDGGDNWYTQFTGYTLAPHDLRDDPTARQVRTISAADGIQARLQHKQMMWHSSYGGWPVDDAFEHILNRAGIPAALISVDSDVTLADMGALYYLPEGEPRGAEVLSFRPDETVVSALDKLAVIRDLEWGVSVAGVYFLRRRPTHVAGHYDWTLDEDTVTDTDTIFRLEHTQDFDEFCNMLYVLVGQGEGARSHTITDLASVFDATAANYIGEDRWRVHIEPDADDAVTLAKRLWSKRTELSRVVYWSTYYHPELMPGDEVRVQVDRCNIPADSIFRITSKDWSIGSDGQFSQSLEGVLVEEGT